MRPFAGLTKDDILNGEARVATKLCRPGAHPNIVEVINHGWLDRSFYHVDMEFCQVTLADYIRKQPIRPVSYLAQNRNESEVFWTTLTTAIYILMEIASGLDFIHQNNEVHRDLKPSNGRLLLICILIRSVIFSFD
jgi:serine/threonine protein kinase